MNGHATSKPTCPRCGAEVPPDAPRGYCLKCLFALGTAEPDVGGQTSEVRGQKTADSPPTDSRLQSLISDLRPLVFGDYELLEEIAQTVAGPGEVEDELKHLFAVLSG